ncbi:MAG: 4Fe-4S dicluster domain-containing protein, partial [Desulfobacteraceae bacterium]|nr:4Fe-4S dicluster domain-containing protein [Desulfobacteraceae bacterium]
MQNDIITPIPVNVMGKIYEVPQGLTIMKALEYSGYRLTRGCGCRGGVCGACATIYRKKGDYRLQVGLACQTVVEPDIYVLQLPFFPANKALYDIGRAVPDAQNIRKLYPELLRCMGCNTCTKSCPMDLEVMNFVSAAIAGDYHRVVERSIECVACGLCAARCPAELAPFNIALLIRRMVGRHLVQPSAQLAERLEEIKSGKYEKELQELKNTEKSEIEKRYQELQAT